MNFLERKKTLTIGEYQNKIKTLSEDFDMKINLMSTSGYFLFLVLAGMVIFFWCYNGIKGRIRDRRRLVC